MTESKILRHPTVYELEESQLAQYMRWLSGNGYPMFRSYDELHAWSVRDLENFWDSIWKWSRILHSKPPSRILSERKMPGAKWFIGAKLNFAENILRYAWEGRSTKVAITAVSESRDRIQLTYGELLRQVQQFSVYLRSEGVEAGDRVAAVLPNGPEAIIGFLACASIGAVWSSCAVEFGENAIIDRFAQIQPKILIFANAYQYNGKSFDLVEKMSAVVSKLSSLRNVVVVPLSSSKDLKFSVPVRTFAEALNQDIPNPFQFAQLPFMHPLYILYSSGTTGAPKCIVHSSGGALLQHIKEHRLHVDLTEYDKFFYFTTCGWMMWNWLVTGLATGAELLLFDGSPSFPSLARLWQFAQDEDMTIFGTSAKFLASCRQARLRPEAQFDLSKLRTILSTGSPLAPEDFDWVYGNLHEEIRLSSISGGTDIVSCFVLGNPILPVRRGEIQCKGLGMAVEAFDREGRSVLDECGELVCTAPAPSMPIAFWNDANGEKYRNAYFSKYPNVWTHGDYVLFHSHGGCTIFGRSDATLNPGGVRIGTAEIYRQIESLDEIQDSLAVGRPVSGDEEVVLYVVMKKGHTLDEDLKDRIRKRIRDGATPRHVPKDIIEVEAIPYTLSGKKVELAVARILRGEPVENRDALANPDSLDAFKK